MDTDELKQQLVDLQTRLTFQDSTINELNTEVTRLSLTLDSMTLQLERLQKQMGLMQPLLSAAIEQEPPPPHY